MAIPKSEPIPALINIAACSGRALVTSVIPSSSRA